MAVSRGSNIKNIKNKDSITERFLYEQFSYEVNSNINSSSFSNKNVSDLLNLANFITPRNSVETDMEIEMKMKSYYDCQGVNDDELNEVICQDKIINSKTCCRAECCLRTNGDEGNNIFNCVDKEELKHLLVLPNHYEFNVLNEI